MQVSVDLDPEHRMSAHGLASRKTAGDAWRVLSPYAGHATPLGQVWGRGKRGKGAYPYLNRIVLFCDAGLHA